MAAEKTVLFVTYGGGHARMVVPVVRALADMPGIKTVTLALTVGGPIFESEGLPYLGFKDFVTPQDKEALAWGRKLAGAHHVAETGISEEETVAYHGLSYQDLVTRYGEADAARLWQEKGRHAFCPISVLERVLDRVRPDMVVTTNSPRSERAAVEVAKRRGIPTLSMVDLFGVHHFHPLEADYITVISKQVIDNMRAEGVTRPRESFLITGNPAFDRAFDYRGPIDPAWRREHLPQMPAGAKALLWADMPAYWDLQRRALHVRSEAEIVRDLDSMAHATQAIGAWMLIRPHPSQQRALYDAWMERHKHPHVIFAGHLPLYPLLKAIDVMSTYTSTVSLEALLMQRRLLQLKYYDGPTDMPFGEWGLAWQAESPEQVAEKMRQAFADDAEAARMLARVASVFPQEKAGPKVAAEIWRILAA